MTSFKKAIAVTTIAATAALTLSACGDSDSGKTLLDDIQAGKVTLGTKFDQPGLGMRATDGTMKGLDVDVAEYVISSIAKSKGWKTPDIEWRETPSAQRETLIKNGEVDMITATYSINKGRAESVNFAGPYLITHQALLVRKDDDAIKNMKDLDNGRKLCSVSGSTPAKKVKDALPGVQLQEFDGYSSCVDALKNGKVDAITTDATILYGYSAQNPGLFKVLPMEKADGQPFTNEYYGIGLKKDDQASTDAVNTALLEMYSTGTFNDLLKKNLGEDAQVVEEGNPGDLSFLK